MKRQQTRRTTWRDPVRGVLGVLAIGAGVLLVGTVIAVALTAVMT